MANSLSALSLLETRVLGTLVEKQRTVPDTYPLSLNSLVAGCNQKTSRNPVLEAGEPEILLAVENLKELGLVSEVSGSRVVRFAHNLEKVLGVPTGTIKSRLHRGRAMLRVALEPLARDRGLLTTAARE